MLVPYQVQNHFFVGALVRRQFDEGVFIGKVAYVADDEGEPLWRVVFDDFDSEDLSLEQMVHALVYHPLMDLAHDVSPPTVGQFVWFSMDQQPRLGKVVAVDPTLPRPVTVRLFEPSTGARKLSLAVFRPVPIEDDGVGGHVQLHLFQIRFGFEALLGTGKLPVVIRHKLDKSLQV